MRKVDLHMHTHFSHDSGAPPRSVVERCLKTGLDCIAVTDHNTIRGALEVRDIAPFQVIIGEEIKSSAGDIIGLFLTREVPRGLSPLETVEAIKVQGGLVMVPHPFDRFRPSAIKYAALQQILLYVDILEAFNAHDLLMRDNQRAAVFCSEYHLVAAAVSDAHTPLELGRTFMEVPDSDATPRRSRTPWPGPHWSRKGPTRCCVSPQSTSSSRGCSAKYAQHRMVLHRQG